jgi:voltage-gated potassium channel
LRSKSGALVLGVRRQDNELIVGPTGEAIIMGGDTLICMGTAEQLRTINRLLDPPPA